MFFYNFAFGIKEAMNLDISLNKDTKPNQTKAKTFLTTFLLIKK